MTKFEDVWFDVRGELDTAKGISFDGCHKIYVLMDDKQVQQSAEWGYGEDGSFLVTDLNADEMLTVVKGWYEGSCGLKFIQSVTTVEDNPNAGYESLVPQGYADEFCDYCGEDGAEYDGVCYDCREDEEDEEEDEDEDEE
jgi:hypothetical protein